MIITKKHLSRRTFLRGTLGATMALPLLEAMVPALTIRSSSVRKKSRWSKISSAVWAICKDEV